MYRIDHVTAAVGLPAPDVLGTQGYFQKGNPGGGTPATVVTADWANAMQEELLYVIEQASLTPSKVNRTQLRQAIAVMIAAAVVIGNAFVDFRLSLTSGLPVTTADVTGATTIYCAPYKGKYIDLYDGVSQWIRVGSAEFSIALGTLTAGKPYDIFCYNNAGVATLEILAWTNDTTRATALVRQDGRLVKSGATTRLYMGTFYTASTTTTEDSVTKRYLWNNYNRVRRPMRVVEATASWTYTTPTFRQANAAAGNQLDCVIGVAEDPVQAEVHIVASANAGRQCAVGIGVDSTTVNSAQIFGGGVDGTGLNCTITCSYRGYPAAGRHTLPWLERSETGGTTTWLGTTANGSIVSGISGEVNA